MLRDIVSFLCEFRKKFLDKGYMAVREVNTIQYYKQCKGI